MACWEAYVKNEVTAVLSVWMGLLHTPVGC